MLRVSSLLFLRTALLSLVLFCFLQQSLCAQGSIAGSVQDSLELLSENRSFHDTVRANACYHIARFNLEKNPEKALVYIRKGAELATSSGVEKIGATFSLMEITGDIFKGNFPAALSKCKEIEPLITRLSNPALTVSWLNNMGTAYYRMGEYDRAGAYYYQVINISRKYGFHEAEVKAIVNLGVMHETRHEYQAMLDQMRMAWNLAREYGLENEMMLARFNQALAESKLNNFGQAITYLEEILPYYEKQQNLYGTAYCLANLSMGYLEIRQYDQAMRAARRSVSIREQLQDQAGLAKVRLTMGRIFMETMRYDSAEIYIQNAIKSAEEFRQMPRLSEAYELLAKLNYQKRDYKSAYESLKLHQTWKDSVYNREKDQRLQEQFKLFKSTYLDSLSTARNMELNNVRREVQVLWALILSVILFPLAYFWYGRKYSSINEDQQADISFLRTISELESDNRVIKQDIVKQNRLLEQLKTGQQLTAGDDLENLRNILREGRGQDNYWNEFLSFFSSVYPHFFERLNEKYPGLTPNEIRFCALMKINLSMLDMANALNISTESVRKARYRLYKKMNLGSDQELAEMMIAL